MPDAGRVIAGRARGLRLLAPGPTTRPLGDRVKETLFAILERELPAATVLDLFAGSGAAGIEALSRGARKVVFVERDPAAVRVIRENVKRARFALAGPIDPAAPPVTAGGGTADVIQSDAPNWLRSRAVTAGPFNVAFVDPPYAESKLLIASLEVLGAEDSGILASGARVVAKHFWREDLAPQVGLLVAERSRRFGETALTFYRRVAPPDPPPASGATVPLDSTQPAAASTAPSDPPPANGSAAPADSAPAKPRRAAARRAKGDA